MNIMNLLFLEHRNSGVRFIFNTLHTHDGVFLFNCNKITRKYIFRFVLLFIVTDGMKLPFIIPISGGGNNYHGYNDAAHDQDDLLEFDGADDFGSESAETFDDYMWMENEEEFDKTEMARLEEEELIKQCMEHAQDDEEDEQLHYVWLEQYE